MDGSLHEAMLTSMYLFDVGQFLNLYVSISNTVVTISTDLEGLNQRERKGEFPGRLVL